MRCSLIRILMVPLLACVSLSAREVSEQYQKLLAAIAYHDLTIGIPSERALSAEGGFEPLFLGMNACIRKGLGAPFLPDTELMLITAVHSGQIIGFEYRSASESPEELAALEAIKSRIEAIYKITLVLDAKGLEKDRVFLRWATFHQEGQKIGRVLTIYDQQLHDELRPSKPDEKSPGK